MGPRWWESSAAHSGGLNAANDLDGWAMSRPRSGYGAAFYHTARRPAAPGAFAQLRTGLGRGGLSDADRERTVQQQSGGDQDEHAGGDQRCLEAEQRYKRAGDQGPGDDPAN